MRVTHPIATDAEVLWWDYTCVACGQTGSCPLPKVIGMITAASRVAEAHGGFNPDCHRKNMGMLIQVRHVGEIDR